MPRLARLATVMLLSLPACTVATGQAVTTPAAHLGRPVGQDFELADWSEVSSYYRRLAEESPRAITETVGTTTEGRDFLITIISSEANLARLDEIRANAKVLADPRGADERRLEAAIDDGVVILFVSCAMHSTETAGVQLGMELAHELATSDDEPWRTARERLVTVIYTTNPDGVDHVVEWYRRTVDTPHEATRMLKLYQYYSGHDNNRDWFMLTQAETRIVTQLLYARWYPQVYWDVHQQGSNRERMFVPPFRDPLNPNLDPAIVSGIDALGSRALHDMTRAGFTGVSTGVSYDMWWNGGNRNVPVRHNIIGLLTEAASVNYASPIFLPRRELAGPAGLEGYRPSNQFPDPWPGGWWRIRDIIDYQMAFGRSLVGSLGREPSFWLRNSLEAAQRTIEKGRAGGPRGWLLPADNRDPAAVHRLVEVLLLAGVEVHVVDEPIEADGRVYPAGTVVIHRDQPYGTHVKDLLEVQRYPGGRPPYDVAGWTLSALLGVRRVEVMEQLAARGRQVSSADEAIAAMTGDERAPFGADRAPFGGGGDGLSSWHSDTWRVLQERLAGGDGAEFITAGERAGIFLGGAGGAVTEEEMPLTVPAMPRIGLYSPWSGSMDEGWMRYVLDSHGWPYVTVRNEMLRAGELHAFLDVLLIPSIRPTQLDRGRSDGSVPDEYAGGLAPEGAVAVEQFLAGGGTVITLGASSSWLIELLEVPLVDTTRGPDAEGFSCPGSVLRGIPARHPLTSGLPGSVGLFFSSSSTWREMTEAERAEVHYGEDWQIDTLMRYAPTRVLISGWIAEPETIENRMAWVRVAYGEGRAHLFGFRPQYRGWAQGTFGLIFRAALLD